MATTETITVEMLLASDKFRAELGKIVAGVKSVGDETKKTGGATGNLLSSMRLGWLAVAGSVYKVVQYAKQAVDDAVKSDRQMRQLSATYAGMSKEALKMAQEIGRAFVMQDDDVSALLASLGTLLQNMGMTKKEALAMSGEMVKVGAELAHMWGGTTEEAVRAMQSALRGNGRAMVDYKISIDDASIKQQALNMGIWNGKDALTQAQTAMASMALITKGAGTAMGSTARDWETFEMQAKRVNLALSETKEAIGHGLVAGFSDAIKDAGRFGSVTEDSMTTVARETKGVVDVFRALWYIIASVFDVASTGIYLTFIAPWQLAYGTVMGVVEAVGDLRRAMGHIVKGEWGKAWESAGNAVEKFKERVKGELVSMGDIIATNFVADVTKAADIIANLGKIAPKAEIGGGGGVLGGGGGSAAGPVNETPDQYMARMNDMLEAQRTANAAKFAEEEKTAQAVADAWKTAWATTQEVAGRAFSVIDQALDASLQKELTASERKRQREIAQANATITDKDALNVRLEEIDKAAGKRKNALQKKAFDDQKKLKAAQIIMDTAVAVVATLANQAILGPIIAAAAAAMIGGLGLYQLDMLNKQQYTPSEYASGGIAGANGPEFAVLGERGPELVIPAAMTQMLLAGGGGGSSTMTVENLVVNSPSGSPRDVEESVYRAMVRLGKETGRGNVLRA